eukprot:726837_1
MSMITLLKDRLCRMNHSVYHWSNGLFNISIIHVSTSTTLSSPAAAQMIKQLYMNDKEKMYDKYDSYKHKQIIQKALDIYHKVDKANVNYLAMNALIKLCVHFELSSAIFCIWDDIEQECIKHRATPHSTIGYPLLIKCCIKSKQFLKGKHLHQMIRNSLIDDIAIQNSLIDMYGYFGDDANALRLFQAIADDTKTDITIGAMIRAFMKSGKHDRAMQIYETYASALGDDIYIKGMWIHYYQTIGDVSNAVRVFNSIRNDRMDIVCIGSMMQTYCNANMNTECIDLFQRIRSINSKLKPDILSYIVVVTACTQATAYQFGSAIHEELKHGNQWMLSELRIQISLIHLYGKCGMMHKCEQILAEIETNENEKYRNEAWIWGSMIKSYGRNGDVLNAKRIFNKMKDLQICADRYSYLSLIHSFAHSGHIEEANAIWEHEIEDKDIKYDKYVISAVVDGLARRGKLHGAKQLIDEYEEYSGAQYHESMWTALLSGCTRYDNLILAEQVHKAIRKRFYDNERYMASSSVLLSNLYAKKGEYHKCNALWAEMKRKGWKKQPGISECDIYGKIHKFYAGYDYQKVQEYKKIDAYLETLVSALKTNYKYQMDCTQITRELEENESATDRMLRHSEKLALMYGLLTTPQHYLLVINKNLRICRDCHNFIKLTSAMKNRKIIVSDVNRVHVFQDGKCSCNEYY